MSADSTAVQGSGWGWLGYNKEKDTVQIATTANQDPCITTGLIPLLGIDVRTAFCPNASLGYVLSFPLSLSLSSLRYFRFLFKIPAW